MSVFLLLFALATNAQNVKPKAKPINAPTYARDIRPVLEARCVVCHNQSAVANATVSGGLALDSYAALSTGVVGKAGATPVYAPGKSESSELLKRLLATSPTRLMPKGGPPLPPAQIELFKKWIDAGASAGDLPKNGKSVRTAPNTVPMPVPHPTQDVQIKTRIAPTPDLLKKDTPKDAALAFALKVGPLAPVTALAYSPDGKLLAVGGYRAITLWDTKTGQPAGCVIGLTGQVLCVAFRPDGTQLAVAGGSPGIAGEARVYDVKTLALVGKPVEGHTDVVYSIAWNADGTKLATGSQDKIARLWEWPSGKLLKEFKDNADGVTRVCFAPDGKSLYTASLDHNVRSFDTNTGAVLKVFSGHNEAVTALALSPDGKSLVSSSLEQRIRWWNLDSAETGRYSDGSGGQVNDIVFSKDGKLMASAAADQRVRIWDANNANQQRDLQGANDWYYAVAFSPDAKFVAGAGADGIVRLWESANGRLRVSLFSWPPVGKSPAPEWAAVTPEGYFDACPAWAKVLRPLLAGQPLNAPQVAAFVQTLHQPENVVKSWQGADLQPAKLPEPPKPAADTKKPAAPNSKAETTKKRGVQ